MQRMLADVSIFRTTPRVRMLDGFNEGWIDFSCDDENRLKGTTSAAEVVAALVEN